MEKLDRVEKNFNPGHGELLFGGYIFPDRYGANASVNAYVRKNITAYAEGWLGKSLATDSIEYGANAGFRWKW